MPITVLDYARGFETGADSANKIYDRINSYAQNQMSLAARNKEVMINNASAEKRSIYERYGVEDVANNPFVSNTLNTLDARITNNTQDYNSILKTSPTADSPSAGLATGQNIYGRIAKQPGLTAEQRKNMGLPETPAPNEVATTLQNTGASAGTKPSIWQSIGAIFNRPATAPPPEAGDVVNEVEKKVNPNGSYAVDAFPYTYTSEDTEIMAASKERAEKARLKAERDRLHQQYLQQQEEGK